MGIWYHPSQGFSRYHRWTWSVPKLDCCFVVVTLCLADLKCLRLMGFLAHVSKATPSFSETAVARLVCLSGPTYDTGVFDRCTAFWSQSTFVCLPPHPLHT
ncbi:unnamed protein product [Ectocarpus sp. 12 AP-2014]